MDWQEITSLVIVVAAVVMLVRYQVKELKKKKNCASCVLANAQMNIRYTQKK